MFTCLLCKSETVEIFKINSNKLRRLYSKHFNEKMKNIFVGSFVRLLRCRNCGFSFFNQPSGDENFYELCKRNPYYFEDWRWEFSLLTYLLYSKQKSSKHLDVGSGSGSLSSALTSIVQESWATDYVSPSHLNPLIKFKYADATFFQKKIQVHEIEHVAGHMHKIHVDDMLISQINRGISELTLYENGKPLEMPNSQHQYIETHGKGRYSHWGNFIFFSSSDNLNPINIDKTYEIKSHDLPLHYFESLSIFHTIEHVDDPIQFLSDHKKFLKPGARVYLSTPNYAAKESEYINGKLDILDFPPHHTSRWRPVDLVNLLKEADITPMNIFLELKGLSLASPLMGETRDRLESLETDDNHIQINGKRFAKLYSSEDLNSLNNLDNTDIGYTVMIEGIT